MSNNKTAKVEDMACSLLFEVEDKADAEELLRSKEEALKEAEQHLAVLKERQLEVKHCPASAMDSTLSSFILSYAKESKERLDLYIRLREDLKKIRSRLYNRPVSYAQTLLCSSISDALPRLAKIITTARRNIKEAEKDKKIDVESKRQLLLRKLQEAAESANKTVLDYRKEVNALRLQLELLHTELKAQSKGKVTRSKRRRHEAADKD